MTSGTIIPQKAPEVAPLAKKVPVVIVVIGMAGSGKTTFVHRLYLHLQSIGKRVYSINMDPAVNKVPYPTNIDIRDTVDYRKVMKDFVLGPNGAMITSLNLFATKFDQVIELVEKRASEFDFVIVDTPGQIEVFNWSASGQIILDALAVSFPLVTAYVTDTARCRNPTTFMSNMTYACSIMYKTKLPFVLVFNKTDVVPCEFAQEWMTDFDSFLEALKPAESGYMATLSRSLCLAMEEFYNQLRSCGVSSLTGAGMPEFMDNIALGVKEYTEAYVPYLEHQRSEMKKKRDSHAARELDRIQTAKPQEDEDEEEEMAELEKIRQLIRNR